METMIPPQVGMRLRTMRERKRKKRKRKEKGKKRKKRKKEKGKMKKKIINKERRGIVSILYHTCASK